MSQMVAAWREPNKVPIPESNRFLALAGLVATFLGVWGLLIRFDDWDHLDDVVISMISVTTGSTVLLMLIFTRHWSIRSLGVLCNMLADFVLYGSAAAARFGWLNPLAEDPLRVNAVRALFLVGCTGLLIGVALYLIHLKRSPGPVAMVDYDVPEHARDRV